MEKSYTWGHSINHSVIYSWRVWMPTNLTLENQTPHKTVATSVYQFRHWDCTANGWELRGLNLQFNIQPRLAIFSKWSTIHITGFLGKVFESAAADKWPEVTRRMTRWITWSWSSRIEVDVFWWLRRRSLRASKCSVWFLKEELHVSTPPERFFMQLLLMACFHTNGQYLRSKIVARP